MPTRPAPTLPRVAHALDGRLATCDATACAPGARRRLSLKMRHAIA